MPHAPHRLRPHGLLLLSLRGLLPAHPAPGAEASSRLRAHPPRPDARDGHRRWPGFRNADPSASPDVRLAWRSEARRIVTFHSGLDSLPIEIGPGGRRDVPMPVERPSPAGTRFGDAPGLQALRRFDVLLDFRDHAAHLRPTPAARDPFPGPSSPFPTLLAAILAAAALVAPGVRLARSPDRTSRPDRRT